MKLVACLSAAACSSGGGAGVGNNGSDGGDPRGQGGASAGSTSGGAVADSGSRTGSGGAGGGNVDSGGDAAASGGSPAGTGGDVGAAGRTDGGSTTGTGGSPTIAGDSGRGFTGGGESLTDAGANAPDVVASSVTPTNMASRYRFTFGDVIFEIDAQTGGRVAKLSLLGTDLIVSSGTDPTTWGSVFWTSPRSDWTPVTWPPPAAIDNSAYTGSISGAHVLMNGPADNSIGVAMSKDYSADATSGWITIAYSIHATKAVRAAPWEVSRVPRGGIVFFPVGSSLTPGPLTVTQSSGIAWFDDASKSAASPNGDKCSADGRGWTAYVLAGNLFLKRFADQPASAQAPGEGEVDVYPGTGFLEFEVQGPYTAIAAGASVPWTMDWRVIKVPSSVTIAVGNASLVDFVLQQVGPDVSAR